jgi:ribosomal-protein-alanine N-acetyltransferase
MLIIEPFCNFSQKDSFYKDLAELDEIVFNAAGSVYDSAFWTEEQFRYPLPLKEQLSFAAFQENKLVGFSVGYAFLPHWHHISRVAVHPEFIGQAIAGKIIAAQLEAMGSLNPSLISVDTKRNNAVALKLYKKMGFSELVGNELQAYIKLRDREPEEYLGHEASHLALINRKDSDFKLTIS